MTYDRDFWMNTFVLPAVAIIAAFLFVIVLGLVMHYDSRSYGRDFGQWTNQDPEISAWFQSLRQPDHPTESCCGEADAYWADSFRAAPDGTYIAIVTDERDDEPLHREHINPGTEIAVPMHKIKWDQGNPTGHGIIFLQPGSHYVWCFLPPGGV